MFGGVTGLSESAYHGSALHGPVIDHSFSCRRLLEKCAPINYPSLISCSTLPGSSTGGGAPKLEDGIFVLIHLAFLNQLCLYDYCRSAPSTVVLDYMMILLKYSVFNSRICLIFSLHLRSHKSWNKRLIFRLGEIINSKIVIIIT